MPLIDDDEPQKYGYSPTVLPPSYAATPDPSIGQMGPKPTNSEMWGAAFKLENEVANSFSIIDSAGNFGEVDREHNPYEAIKGTELEPYLKHFAGSRNQAETDHISRKIREEMKARKILAMSGWGGFGAQIISSILSPTTLLPGGAVVKGGRAGYAAGRSALSVGGANVGATAIQEGLLQNQQYTRSMLETALALGGSAVLGGALGGAMSAAGSRSLANISKAAQDMDVDGAISRSVETGTPSGARADLSGAASPAKAPIELKSALGLEKALSFQDPVLRAANSPSVAAREVMAEMADTVLYTTRNAAGETNAPRGGSIESRLKTQGVALEARAVSAVRDLWMEHRFGQKVSVPGLKDMIQGRKAGLLSEKEFRIEVGKAMARGDAHDVPEVAKAAKAVRAELIDPVANSAILYRVLDAEVVQRMRPKGTPVASKAGGIPDPAPQPKPVSAMAEEPIDIDPMQAVMLKDLLQNLQNVTGREIPPDQLDFMTQQLAGDPDFLRRLSEIVRGGPPDFAAQAGPVSTRSWMDVGEAIEDGKAVTIGNDVVEAMESAVYRLDSELPQALADVPKYIVTHIDPDADGMAVATFRRSGTDEVKEVPIDVETLSSIRAFHMGGEIFFLKSGVGNFFGGVGDNIADELAGQVWHEGVHALFHRYDIGDGWLGDGLGRLISHANNLRVLDGDMLTFLKAIKADDADLAPAGVTIRETYEHMFRDQPARLERVMQEEAVAHMIEMRFHGHFTDDLELAPVKDIMDELFGPMPATAGRGGDEIMAAVQRTDIEPVTPGLDMSQEARLQRARDMGFDTSEVFYHGTGAAKNFDDGFDPVLSGAGNDQYGSGFYFTNRQSVASGYATARIDDGVEKLGGEGSPGVIPVYLKIKKPINLNASEARHMGDAIDLTDAQAREMISRAPNILGDADDTPLGNWFDVWSDGVHPHMIDDVAGQYAGPQAQAIEGDFYSDHSNAFRRALSDVTGYDGMTVKFDDGQVHKVAWFPEQVRSVNAAFDPANADSSKLMAAAQMSARDVSRVEPTPAAVMGEYPGLGHRRAIVDNHKAVYEARTAVEKHGKIEKAARIDAKRALDSGLPVRVDDEALADLTASLQSYREIIPRGVRLTAVGEVRAIRGTGDVEVDIIGNLRSGRTITETVQIDRATLFGSQAIISRDGKNVLLFNLAGSAEEFGNALRGQVSKVSAESRLLQGGLAADVRSRLFAHVDNLDPLNKTLGRYARERGDVMDARFGEMTLSEYYGKRYAADPEKDDLLKIKAVGHMVEDYASGRMGPETVKLVENDLKKAAPGVSQMMFAARPVADTVLYRGEVKGAEGGLGHHFTRSFERAKGFAGPDGQVFAVRVPNERMGSLKPSRDRNNFVIPADIRASKVAVSSPRDMGMMFAGQMTAKRPPSVPGTWGERELNPLGFFSVGVDAARALKQAKGTPEQMLSQLKKGGMKQNEIDATGLEDWLDGQKSVTRDGLTAFLEMQRVEVLEARYNNGPRVSPERPKIEAELAEMDAETAHLKEQQSDARSDAQKKQIRKRLQEIDRRYVQALSRLRSLEPMESKWSQYSIDPSNPTYRETVLHLPAKDAPNPKRMHPYIPDLDAEEGIAPPQDFRSGHFDEPNAISHLRTSMQPDAEGKKNFVINELQSDWGQKVRDDGGVRNAAKVQELSDRVLEAKANADKFRDKAVIEIHRAENKISKKDGFVEPLSLDDVKSMSDEEIVDLMADVNRFVEFSNKGAAFKYADAIREWKLRDSELQTADQAGFGHPLVNTTDQWVNTSLRRALRQAVEDGSDYIAISSGETVDSFDMGAPLNGLQYAYNEMYPKKLRDIIKKIDKDAAKPESVDELLKYDGSGGVGSGFTRFPMTDKLKKAVMTKGLPMFAVGPKSPLLTEIRRLGGIKDITGDLKAMDAHKSRGIVSDQGLEPDRMREALVEGGFLKDDAMFGDGLATSTLDDLYEGIREAMSGLEKKDFGSEEYRYQIMQRASEIYEEAFDEPLNLGAAQEDMLFDLVIKQGQQIDDALEKIGSQGEEIAPKPFHPDQQTRAGRMQNELQDRAREAGYDDAAPPFSKEVGSEVWDDGGQSYITRIYKKERIRAKRPEFKSIITDYLWGARNRAEAVLNRIQRQVDEGILDAGKAQKDIDDLRQFTGLSDAELADQADSVIEHILGAKDGRVTFDLPAALRGPLKSRTLRIKDTFEARAGKFEDFLERDINVIARYYNRTMVPQVEIARMFGSLDMKDQIAKITDEYNDKLLPLAKTEAERAKLERRKQTDIRDLLAQADRLQGMYGLPDDPLAWTPRLAAAAKNFSYITKLGGMTVSALPDLLRTVMVRGAGAFVEDGLAPLLHGLKNFKAAGREVEDAGTALEMVMPRGHAVADIMDDYGRHSPVERGLGWAADNFGYLSLMNQWNGTLKKWAGAIIMNNVLKASRRVAKGTAKAGDVEKLAKFGLDDFDARIVAEQFEKHGGVEGGIYLANTRQWDLTDPNVANAMESFRAGLATEIDLTIVTPGMDKPLWLSTWQGSFFGQFKSFGIASVQRTLLLGLQQKDSGVLLGATMMIGLGMVSEALKATANDKPFPSDEAQWLAAGVDRSGLTGYFMEVNNLAERMTLGNVGVSALTGKQLSRFASRNTLGSFIGPSAGTLQDITGALQGFTAALTDKEDIREADLAALRRLIPLQNLFYLAYIFQKMEQAVGDGIGVKRTGKRRMKLSEAAPTAPIAPDPLSNEPSTVPVRVAQSDTSEPKAGTSARIPDANTQQRSRKPTSRGGRGAGRIPVVA